MRKNFTILLLLLSALINTSVSFGQSGTVTLNERFDTWPPEGWTLKYKADETSWIAGTTDSHSDPGHAYHDDILKDCDDWLISPQFKVEKGAILTFFEKNKDTFFYDQEEKDHTLMISTTDTEFDSFSLLQELKEDNKDKWVKRYINLSAYEGKDIYIAFRFKGKKRTMWNIDDVVVKTTHEKDLELREVSFEGLPIIGNKIDINTSIKNTGTIAVASSKCQLFNGDEMINEIDIDQIEPDAIKQVSFKDITVTNKTLNLSAKIIFDEDQFGDDNIRYLAIKPIQKHAYGYITYSDEFETLNGPIVYDMTDPKNVVHIGNHVGENPVSAGVIVDGIWYAVTHIRETSKMKTAYYPDKFVTIDLTTGDRTEIEDIEKIIYELAYNPITGEYYALTRNDETGFSQLNKFDIKTGELELISENNEEQFYVSFAIDKYGRAVGLNMDSEIKQIELNSFSGQKIGQINAPVYFLHQSMAFDNEDNILYMNPYNGAYSYVYKADFSKNEITGVDEIYRSAEITSIAFNKPYSGNKIHFYDKLSNNFDADEIQIDIYNTTYTIAAKDFNKTDTEVGYMDAQNMPNGKTKIKARYIKDGSVKKEIEKEIDVTESANIELEVVLGSTELESNNISIFPQPAKDIINLEADASGSLKIHNSVGQVVIETEVSKGKNVINVSNLKSGLYVLKLNSEKGRVNQTIIIED
ncbi:MAG: choice-of-anchor J domain-containing protein [Hyphomicrobiales bacterium]